MPEQTIDPIFAPSALNGILSKMRDDDTFGSLREQMQLQGKVNEGAQTAVIILAGGSGERFGHEGGKQLVEIAGKPILTRSAEVNLSNDIYAPPPFVTWLRRAYGGTVIHRGSLLNS